MNQLLADLRSDVRDVQRSSIRELGRLRCAEAVAPLCDLLDGETDGGTRSLIVKVLGKIGDRAAVPNLVRHYDSLESGALVNALVSLGVFDAVIPKGSTTMDARLRRQMKMALRRAAPDLKALVVEDRLSASEIRRVIPPVM